ncbi:hypothetical protein [Sulfuricurvum sp. UBA5598]|uniref:hypothetical protein n=1 Tax=Sulfuricurvum sp. UBA5598 TaxID=1947586 RepID=UPI0025F5BEB6|nr:hypothetical protein [Sulfuricurvum sp. UBA5598]
MKPLFSFSAAAVALAVLSSSAYAGMHHRHHHYAPRHVKMAHSQQHANWVVPLVIGGVLGYALSEPRRESLTYVQTAYSPAVYPPLYEERWVYFGDCDCQRKVLVKVQ